MAGSVLFMLSLIASGNLVFDTDLARFAPDVVKLSVNEIGNLRNAIPSYQFPDYSGCETDIDTFAQAKPDPSPVRRTTISSPSAPYNLRNVPSGRALPQS